MYAIAAGSNLDPRRYNRDELSRLTIELAAFDANIGVGAIVVPDPSEADSFATGRGMTIFQDNTLITRGYIADNDRGRGPDKAEGHETVYSLEDANARLANRRGRGWVRGAETDVARVQAYAAFFVPFLDTSWLLTTNPVNLPAKTYRTGDITPELVQDLVDYTGKTLFSHAVALGSNADHLHYHRLTEGHTAGITISDNPAAVDGVTVYAPIDPSRRIDPTDLRNNILFRDQAGRTTTVRNESSITTHDTDGRKHQDLLEIEATSQSDLEAKAASLAAEVAADRITYFATIGPMDGTALALWRPGDLVTTTSSVLGLTASPQRIAHATLTLAQDDSGGTATDLWYARLELGAPIRLPTRRGAVSPVPDAPFQPPEANNVLACGTVLADAGVGVDVGAWGINTGIVVNRSDFAAGDTFDVDIVMTNPSGGWYAYIVGFSSGPRGDEVINAYLPNGQQAGGPLTPPAFQLIPSTETGGAVQTASGSFTMTQGMINAWDTTYADIMYLSIRGATSPGVATGGGQGYICMTRTSGPSFVTTSSEGPNVGQLVPSELAGTGNGTTTTYQTVYPYQPGSLIVSVGGVLTPVTETDPATGTFTLGFAPPPGAEIVVWYGAADATPTGATGGNPVPLTPSIPPEFLDNIKTVAVDLTNRSGTARFAGDVVVVDTATDDSFTTSAASNTLVPVGVLSENTAIGSNGRVIFSGYAESVAVGSNALATRGSYLYQSTTATRASFMPATSPSAGAFGYVVAAGSNTSPSALIFPTYSGIGGAATISAGSNSTRVREDPTAGASTSLWSPFDHAHDGIGTITSSASNTMQRGTWNLRPGSGIALSLTDTDGDGEYDTTTIVNTGQGGGGAISAGSNSTRVREVSTAGASSSLWSPYDHAHDGIGTITASSSNTLQRGTFNLRPGAGIALNLTDTDGDGEFDTATIVNTGSGAGGSGGDGPIAPDVRRLYSQTLTNGTSHVATVDAAASGQRLIVVVDSYARDVDSITCTNVTFTEVLAVNFSTGVYLSVYVGVVSGGSSGTTLTVNCTGSNWIIVDVYEVADALTPTAGSSATLTDTNAGLQATVPIGPITVAQGTFFVAAAAQNDGTTAFGSMGGTAFMVAAARPTFAGLSSAIGYTGRSTLRAWVQGGGTSGADFAAGIIAIT